MLKILFLGDVVGSPGRRAVIESLPRIKSEHEIDFIIVNGENAAGGRGITAKIAIDLMRAGAAVITTGDHAWDQREIIDYFPTEPRLLRPLNYPEGTPGAGVITLETEKGLIAVLQAQGRTFMKPALENPFLMIKREVAKLHQAGIKMIFVDFHAEATSEKIAMGRALDGLVSVVAGTHTHVQTADEQIFPGGTGYISDAGMCGPTESILGREIESIIWQFEHSMPTRFPVAKGGVRLCGIIAEIDTTSGHCVSMKRLRQTVDSEESKKG